MDPINRCNCGRHLILKLAAVRDISGNDAIDAYLDHCELFLVNKSNSLIQALVIVSNVGIFRPSASGVDFRLFQGSGKGAL